MTTKATPIDSNIGTDTKEPELSGVEQDIIASCEMEKLAVLDEIENKLDMVEGSLDFAIEHAENKGFYLSLNDHIKGIANLLSSLRK